MIKSLNWAKKTMASTCAYVMWDIWNIALHVIFNTLRPRQNDQHFADDTFKCIFLKENVRTSIEISLKFVPKSPINNIPALFQIMTWRRPGDKPLSEAMMVSLLTHICVARPQWVNCSSWPMPFPFHCKLYNGCNYLSIMKEMNMERINSKPYPYKTTCE